MKQISLSKKEEMLCNLLMDVVLEKAPGTTLRIAGGWTRDKLLGSTTNDIDISIDTMTGEKFAHLVTEYMDDKGIKHGNISVIKSNPDQSKHLETAMVAIYGMHIDFVNLRKETYADSRIPSIEIGTPEEDAKRRDLTINALFYNINDGEVEDFVGGLKDLDDYNLRTPIDARQTFLDDPLRMLRIIRFAARYGYDVDDSIIEAANKDDVKWALLNKVSKERMWTEIAGQEKPEGWKNGILNEKYAIHGIELFNEMGLRDLLFWFSPEEKKSLGLDKDLVSFDSDQNNPHHDLTIWDHTCKVIDNLEHFRHLSSREDELVLMLSALLHDIGKCDLCSRQETDEGYYTYHGHEDSSAKMAECFLNKMKAPVHITKRVVRLVAEHMRLHNLPDNASDKSLRRFMRDLEDDWEMSVNLAIADAMGKKNVPFGTPDRYINFKNRMKNLKVEMGNKTTPSRPISGHDLMSLGIPAGPQMGKLLKQLDEELLENPAMSKDEAINFVKSLNV